MFLSCSSQSFDSKFMDGSMDLFKYIDHAKKIGLTCVEFEDKHFESLDGDYLAKIAQKLKDTDMRCSNLAFFCSFGFPTDKENAEEVEKAISYMDAAVKIGAENFRLFAGWVGGPDTDIGKVGPAAEKTQEDWSRMEACLVKCCEEAKKRGLTCVIENHNHGGFLSNSADVKKLFREVKCDNLSLLLDTGNYTDGIEGNRATVQLATRHIHLKLNYIEENGHDRMYDLPENIAIIKAAGFEGTLSMEYEGTQDPMDCMPKVIAFLNANGIK